VAKENVFFGHKRAPAVAGLWLAGIDHIGLPFEFFVFLRGKKKYLS
jgi:hypothetical protein